jgi:isopentenyl phosphate kinase
LYSDIGQIQLIPLKTNYNSEQPIKLKSKETEFIPRIIQNGSYKFIDLSGPEVIERLKDGNYRIVSDEIIGNLSLNVNRKESSVHLMSQEGIISEFKDKKITNVQANKFSKSFDVTKINLNLPAEYWRICIFIAIMSVISEILISKFWKS